MFFCGTNLRPHRCPDSRRFDHEKLVEPRGKVLLGTLVPGEEVDPGLLVAFTGECQIPKFFGCLYTRPNKILFTTVGTKGY